MNLPLLIGSVVGVLVLAWTAWLLGLGGAAIPDEPEARRLAEASDVTFTADQAWLSTDGKAALVRGADGSWMVLKVHGAQVAARRLATLEVKPAEEGVTVATGERMFGDVHLQLPSLDRDRLLTAIGSAASAPSRPSPLAGEGQPPKAAG